MRTSEFEYYLISTLIDMEDRFLAKKIELHIWSNGPHPQGKILQKYIDILRASNCVEKFIVEAEQLLAASGAKFREAPITKCVTLMKQPKDTITYGPEHLVIDENQEGVLADHEM